MSMPGPKPRPIYERMMAKVERCTDGCWRFTGSAGTKGHGHIGERDGTQRKAHRVAWEHAHGAIADDMCVCHSCDVPNCVNPEHLFLGSIADNNRDMRTKRRHAHGAGHGQAKLDDIAVRTIKSLRGRVPQTELAQQYGVHQSLISRIMSGRYWSHIEQRG